MKNIIITGICAIMAFYAQSQTRVIIKNGDTSVIETKYDTITKKDIVLKIEYLKTRKTILLREIENLQKEIRKINEDIDRLRKLKVAK